MEDTSLSYPVCIWWMKFLLQVSRHPSSSRLPIQGDKLRCRCRLLMSYMYIWEGSSGAETASVNYQQRW